MASKRFTIMQKTFTVKEVDGIPSVYISMMDSDKRISKLEKKCAENGWFVRLYESGDISPKSKERM